jgi:hypothetical protein
VFNFLLKFIFVLRAQLSLFDQVKITFWKVSLKEGDGWIRVSRMWIFICLVIIVRGVEIITIDVETNEVTISIS